ncbi:MAG: response regulator transcription factor [Acidobacteriota bacterium]
MIKLVLADDHPIVLDGLAQILKLESDFAILATCTNGEDALTSVRTLRPDVLVLDLRMPGTDGLSVLRTIKKDQIGTTVVLLTAALDEKEVLEAIRMGARGVILKSMASRLLVQCIRKVHAGGQWLEKESVASALQHILHNQTSTTPAAALSPRELDVVKMAAQGLRNKQIAEKLFISEATVKIHLHNIYEKLNIGNRVELSLYAREKGLV